MTSDDDPPAAAEIMACVLARDLADGEFVGLGAASQIPMAATRLARRMHAPNLSWICGGSGAINSGQPCLLPSAADPRNLFQAEYRTSMEDVVDLEMRGRNDVVFYGGIQIDRFGNANMVCVGPYDRPRLRGPGSVGLSLAGSFGRMDIFVQHHDPRILVERVDFVSGAGHSPDRARWAIPSSRGPNLLVTPIAVFDFATPSREARLVSVHGGASVDAVLARTGFAPALAPVVIETPPPSADELHILRTEIDRAGALRTLIAA